MKQINQIREKLRPYLGWYGARLSFIAVFMIALFHTKAVNLARLATILDGTAQEASKCSLFDAHDFSLWSSCS